MSIIAVLLLILIVGVAANDWDIIKEMLDVMGNTISEQRKTIKQLKNLIELKGNLNHIYIYIYIYIYI